MSARESSDRVTTAASQVLDLTSERSGRRYRLLVAWPLVPAPASGYPVLFVLDGDGYFGLATDATRNRGSIGREIAPAVVVGISYPDEDPTAWHRRRALEFTPSLPGPGEWPDPESTADGFGGLETFLDFLDREAKPAVAALGPVNLAATALFGHSLGGLAVVHALLTRPDSFRTFLTVSPALWWNARAVLGHEAAFASRVEAGEVSPRVLVAVGALEETPPATLPPDSRLTLEEVAHQVARSRMVASARELAARLGRAHGDGGYAVSYLEMAGESHITVPFAALRPALDLAFPLQAEEAKAV